MAQYFLFSILFLLALGWALGRSNFWLPKEEPDSPAEDIPAADATFERPQDAPKVARKKAKKKPAKKVAKKVAKKKRPKKRD